VQGVDRYIERSYVLTERRKTLKLERKKGAWLARSGLMMRQCFRLRKWLAATRLSLRKPENTVESKTEVPDKGIAKQRGLQGQGSGSHAVR
jgi:hypothetical protein